MVAMEWACYTEGAEPHHRDWNVLSEFQTKRLQEGDAVIYLQQGQGTAFKLNRVESYTVPHLYQTATKHAAIQLGSRFSPSAALFLK